MIRVLAAPTEFALTAGSYARTYRLLRAIDADDVAVTAYANTATVTADAFPATVSIQALEQSSRLTYYLALYRQLYRRVRSADVDVYQHANLGFRGFNPALLAPPDPDTPILIGPAEGGHAVPSAEFQRVLARQFGRELPAWLESGLASVAEPIVRSGVDPIRERLFAATLERADRIVVVHDDARRRYERYTDGDTIEVIPYGVDMAKFPYQGGPGDRSLVTVGNLIERKGHRHLIDAMAQIRAEMPDATLDIVGTGPLRDALEARADERGVADVVTFHGRVPEDRLVELLHRARAFVHPSLSEGFSHVRLEAMATGCPVVGTDVAGARSLTTDGVEGFVVPTADPDALASRALELLADARLATAMGRVARETVERNHDYRTIAARYCEIYRELADS